MTELRCACTHAKHALCHLYVRDDFAVGLTFGRREQHLGMPPGLSNLVHLLTWPEHGQCVRALYWHALPCMPWYDVNVGVPLTADYEHDGSRMGSSSNAHIFSEALSADMCCAGQDEAESDGEAGLRLPPQPAAQ